MLKLYGSTTSPFVRRLRIWLANTEHEFVNMQIVDGPDREILAARARRYQFTIPRLAG